MNKNLRAALAALSIASVCAPLLAAGDHGHDHGPAAPAGEASPRFESYSDLFELVGVLEKGQLTVYLDRYATNEPIANARVEFESGANKGVAAPQSDGTYAIKFAGLDEPGQRPFSFTVVAGSDTDLLAGELTVAAVHDDHGDAASLWGHWLGVGAAALGALTLLAVGVRKLMARRARRDFA